MKFLVKGLTHSLAFIYDVNVEGCVGEGGWEGFGNRKTLTVVGGWGRGTDGR